MTAARSAAQVGEDDSCSAETGPHRACVVKKLSDCRDTPVMNSLECTTTNVWLLPGGKASTEAAS